VVEFESDPFYFDTGLVSSLITMCLAISFFNE